MDYGEADDPPVGGQVDDGLKIKNIKIPGIGRIGQEKLTAKCAKSTKKNI